MCSWTALFSFLQLLMRCFFDTVVVTKFEVSVHWQNSLPSLRVDVWYKFQTIRHNTVRVCRFWAWSERVKDDESGDDNRNELTSEWEEVSQDMTGEADGMNQGVDSRVGVIQFWMSDLWISMWRWLVGEKGWQLMRSGCCEGVEQRSDCENSWVWVSGCKNFVGVREKRNVFYAI